MNGPLLKPNPSFSASSSQTAKCQPAAQYLTPEVEIAEKKGVKVSA